MRKSRFISKGFRLFKLKRGPTRGSNGVLKIRNVADNILLFRNSSSVPMVMFFKLVDVDLVTDVNYYRPQNIFIRFIYWILHIPLD